jgi:hypothetical protein
MGTGSQARSAYTKVSRRGELGKLRGLKQLGIKLKISPDLYIYGQLICEKVVKIIQ